MVGSVGRGKRLFGRDLAIANVFRFDDAAPDVEHYVLAALKTQDDHQLVSAALLIESAGLACYAPCLVPNGGRLVPNGGHTRGIFDLLAVVGGRRVTKALKRFTENLSRGYA